MGILLALLCFIGAFASAQNIIPRPPRPPFPPLPPIVIKLPVIDNIQPVQVTEVEGSDLIGRIGYDAEKQIAYVQMLYSTDWYGYEGVAPEVFEAFKAAESKGAFFNTQLKGKYPTHRWEW